MRVFAFALAASSILAACGDDDPLVTGRADSGVLPRDSGIDDTLPFQVGMRFRYRAQLNYRSNTNEAKDAIYTLDLTLTAVDDRGPMGMSTVTSTSQGMRTFDQNWDQTAGAHSWVAALGPVNTGESVSASAAVFDLTRAPAFPADFPKRLPVTAIMFLDMRRQEEIRRAFTDHYTAIGPRFISPAEDPARRWVLALDGTDANMELYPMAVRKRKLSLAYDPKGWLVELSETLGDTTVPNTPSGRFTLTLIAGPQ